CPATNGKTGRCERACNRAIVVSGYSSPLLFARLYNCFRIAASNRGARGIMSGELCVLCGKPVSEPVLQVTPEGMDGTHTPRAFTLLRCDSCGLVMTAPRLDQAEL